MDELELIQERVVRLSARLTGLVLGLLGGIGLFLATIILVLKGGPNVGQHLELLANYFPGYRVTIAGSFFGFAYGFLLGWVLGYVIGVLYNRIAR